MRGNEYAQLLNRALIAAKKTSKYRSELYPTGKIFECYWLLLMRKNIHMPIYLFTIFDQCPADGLDNHFYTYIYIRTCARVQDPKRIGLSKKVNRRGSEEFTRSIFQLPSRISQGCPYILVMDCAVFFHQWRVAIPDRHKLTVVSHRGAEQWNVGVIGHRNTTAYVQREMDNLFRDYPFAKALSMMWSSSGKRFILVEENSSPF